MGHRNARLTFLGRCLLVERVRDQGMAVAHVAKAMGVSRQCAHRWLRRFEAEGLEGLHDRSSRPHHSPRRMSPEVEDLVVAARREHRRGPDWLGPELGLAPRSVNRALRRRGEPRLCVCDPISGQVIRTSKTTALRYERSEPGELVHMDVKKIGRIRPGGGWRLHGRANAPNTWARKSARIGYDYVHSVVDDHSRFAYSEILDNETAASTVAFFTRALEAFALVGVVVRSLMTDNAWNYTHSRALASLLSERQIEHLLIRPHCPWQNGKVERFNRTLQVEWAYRQPFRSNEERAEALEPWLIDYNCRRRHSALGGQPPVSRLSPT
jgi:transposase InsO family protein